MGEQRGRKPRACLRNQPTAVGFAQPSAEREGANPFPLGLVSETGGRGGRIGPQDSAILMIPRAAKRGARPRIGPTRHPKIGGRFLSWVSEARHEPRTQRKNSGAHLWRQRLSSQRFTAR